MTASLHIDEQNFKRPLFKQCVCVCVCKVWYLLLMDRHFCKYLWSQIWTLGPTLLWSKINAVLLEAQITKLTKMSPSTFNYLKVALHPIRHTSGHDDPNVHNLQTWLLQLLSRTEATHLEKSPAGTKYRRSSSYQPGWSLVLTWPSSPYHNIWAQSLIYLPLVR